jgi:tRNA pseudouridine55 synthase
MKSKTDGFLLLDKPRGISSFKAILPIKKKFPGRKIGYAGVLDPDATGLMIVAVGKATRLLPFLEDMPKRYRFTAVPGIETDTYDISGTITRRREVSAVSENNVKDILCRFRGEITQIPPVYSALKIKGMRACDRVRRGETVTLRPRRVFIYELQMTGWTGNYWYMEMLCSKGTYVRSLVHDLGQMLQCGAAASEIRRLAVGDFHVNQSLGQGKCPDNSHLLPMETAVAHLPGVEISTLAKAELAHGRQLAVDKYNDLNGNNGVEKNLVKVLDTSGALTAIGRVDVSGNLIPKKVFI